MNRMVGWMLAVLLTWSFPSDASGVAREKARRINCAGNLKQIWLGLTIYAGDHDGRFPDRLELLHEGGYLTAGKVYRCPSAFRVHPETPISGVGIDDFSACDYLYLGPPPVGLSPEESAAWPVACDMSYNHHPAYRPKLDRRWVGDTRVWVNFLYADGHVKGEWADDLHALAAKRGWTINIPAEPAYVAPFDPYPALLAGGVIGLILAVFGLYKLSQVYQPSGVVIVCFVIGLILILQLLPAC